MTANVLMCGVGGQGIITASAVLAEAALLAGADVKKSEVHGMSQRGGSVETHLRLSRDEAVRSPLIPAGMAEVLLAFEILEALRNVGMTCPRGIVITDDRQIAPLSVTMGSFPYPPDPVGDLRATGRVIHVVPGFDIATQLGEPRAANMVLLGAASTFVAVAPDVWPEAMRAHLRPRALEASLRAFAAGRAALAAGR
jgi:indolepyruvate ferredoxin oxidoreductase beta subunit